MQKLLAQPVLQGSYMAFVNSRELQGLPSVSPDKPVRTSSWGGSSITRMRWPG